MKTNHLACLHRELPAAEHVPDTIQLLPEGSFRATDGRPFEVDAWILDAQGAQRLIEQAAARANPYLIDYEHQTILSKDNGQPAPASGWFAQLEWRQGSGLWAVGVEWTDRARAMIAAREYRFISPVFMYDKAGRVQRLLHAALTNDPALDGMAAVAALNLNLDPQPAQDTRMNPEILKLLGLAENATEAEALTALQALIEKLNASEASMADLKAQSAPLTAMQALQNQVAALTASAQAREVDDLIKSALADGRLLPVMEAWARDLGKTNVAALKAYTEQAQPIAALSGVQTAGRTPKDAATPLSADEMTACTLLGQTPGEYLAFKTAHKE